jgi:hypothetical protein
MRPASQKLEKSTLRRGRQSRIVAPGFPVGDSGPMHGPDILARTLSVAVPTGSSRALWQYHSRGDRHSKVACWGILFDLLQQCSTLTEHVRSGRVACGINHEMKDFKQGRKKNLDLVLCVPGASERAPKRAEGFKAMVERHSIVLNTAERKVLDGLPDIPEAPVGSVHVALEAKACMTEHIKAMPRLYDELNSSHLTVHGSSEMVIAVGFVMVNIASTFQSPSRPTVSKHRQPFAAEKVVAKVRELPRRSSVADTGFDAMSIVVVDCQNDGSPVQIRNSPPAPPQGDIFHYDSMIHRLAQLYASRFPRI